MTHRFLFRTLAGAWVFTMIALGIGVFPAWAKVPSLDELIETLQSRRPIPPMDLLVRDLEHNDPRRRWLAAREMARANDPDAVPQLMKRLGDRNLEVRRQAMESLFTLGRDIPAERFEKAFDSGLGELANVDVLVAQALYEELRGRTEEARTGYKEAFQKDDRRYWEAYRAFPTEALLPLIQSSLMADIQAVRKELNVDPVEVRATYPQNHLRQAHALTRFVEILSRRVGYEALARFSAGQEAQGLALKKSMADLLAAARDLDQRAKGFELELKVNLPQFEYSDSDPGLAEEIALAEARTQAARMLGEYDRPASGKALIQALREDPGPDVRLQAASSLGRLCRPEAASALAAAFEIEATLQVRRVILGALACERSPRTRQVILQAAGQDEFKEAALAALGRMAGPEDIRFLTEAAKNPDYTTRVDDSLGTVTMDRESIPSAIADALETAAAQRPEAEAAQLKKLAAEIRDQIRRPPAAASPPGTPPRTPAPSPSTTPSSPGPGDAKPIAAEPAAVPSPTPREDEAALRDLLAAWLASWQNRNLDRFMAHYHPRFQFPGGLNAFREQKAKAFEKHQNLAVAARDVQIQVQGNQARITFTQDFKSDQLADLGKKTLQMERDDGRWKIKSETWKKMNAR